jgi:hypothetical protein
MVINDLSLAGSLLRFGVRSAARHRADVELTCAKLCSALDDSFVELDQCPSLHRITISHVTFKAVGDKLLAAQALNGTVIVMFLIRQSGSRSYFERDGEAYN